MTETERFDKFCKKIYEVLHLHYRHYLPQGKPEPVIYRPVFYELHKMYYNGALDELAKEPILEEEVKQLDLFIPLMEKLESQKDKKEEETLPESHEKE